MTAGVTGESLRAVFRGRLLAGLLLAEFAAAMQTVVYAAVLPLASRELTGESLYGATSLSGALVGLTAAAAVALWCSRRSGPVTVS